MRLDELVSELEDIARMVGKDNGARSRLKRLAGRLLREKVDSS